LLENACECAGRNGVAGLAGDGYSTRLRRVLELAVAALGFYLNPTVIAEPPQNFADFHAAKLIRRMRMGQVANWAYQKRQACVNDWEFVGLQEHARDCHDHDASKKQNTADRLQLQRRSKPEHLANRVEGDGDECNKFDDETADENNLPKPTYRVTRGHCKITFHGPTPAITGGEELTWMFKPECAEPSG
jgi:hypothetical protein